MYKMVITVCENGQIHKEPYVEESILTLLSLARDIAVYGNGNGEKLEIKEIAIFVEEK